MARLLIKIGGGKNSDILKAALQMMETVVEHDPEDLEHKIWALRDLGVWYWKICHDSDKALKTLDEAIMLMNTTDQIFHLIESGEIWAERLYLLSVIGKEKQAIEEAKHKIQRSKEWCSNLENNSYLYYGYLFLGYTEAAKGNYQLAVSQVYEAAVYCNQNFRKEVEDIWLSREKDYEQTYLKMSHCIRGTHGWDV